MLSAGSFSYKGAVAMIMTMAYLDHFGDLFLKLDLRCYLFHCHCECVSASRVCNYGHHEGTCLNMIHSMLLLRGPTCCVERKQNAAKEAICNK